MIEQAMIEQAMIDKLSIILTKIQDGSYGLYLLNDVDKLSGKIAEDIKSDRDEAIAILGFLLQNRYVKIDPQKGIVLADASKLRKLSLIR
jgi:hypothetical protein